MNRRRMEFLALAGVILFVMGSLTGRVSNSPARQSERNIDINLVSDTLSGANTGNMAAGDSNKMRSSNTTLESGAEKPSGSILMVGSTSMEAYAMALAERYMEIHPGVDVSAELVGSGAGVEAVLGGRADIGNSSRNLNDEEKEAGAVENVVAIDGIVVCVDPANPVSDLTKQQLIDIYTAVVTNWSEVDGEDFPIVVVGREAGAGTRSAFEELLGIGGRCVYANELDSTGAVMARVAFTPGAIGYVSLDVVNDSVKVLQLEGVAPTSENIKAGSYFLCRPFVMATRGKISVQSELVQDWFEYVLGEEGQSIASSVGLVPIE